MSRSETNIPLDAIRIEGGVFPAEFLSRVRHAVLKGQSEADYGIPRGLKLRDEIGRYWRIALGLWERHELASDGKDGVVDVWTIPLLSQVFGYEHIASTAIVTIGERDFPLTHSAIHAAMPCVLCESSQDLNKADVRFGHGNRKRSPSGCVQEYLNACDSALWGLTSNGETLRLFRDNPSLTRPAYIEIDLARIFREQLYADFTTCWLLLHSTRFAPQENRPESCIAEGWREEAIEAGQRALDNLRDGVTEALRCLGNGFLSHKDNRDLLEKIGTGTLSGREYFQQLLRLVYRMLFLFAAEDRGILHRPDAGDGSRDLYSAGYSLSHLRDKAERRIRHDSYADCWEALCVAFAALDSGSENLGLPPLGGLFSSEQCPALKHAKIANRDLLAAIRHISLFRTGKHLTRINYRDMDSEELGSVYESLLELVPEIRVVSSPWRFAFIGDDAEDNAARGHARKLTGSYYTPDSLVQELIRTALVPVINQRLVSGGTGKRDALLSLKVVDPACGSGHFLLAAARRIAAEVATIDAGADQPTEEHFRHAIRDVVSHCIYGVDVNPLAVELCKTALWLETIEPGKPLGFLDAHIRCGNSLVGIVDPELMDSGIPDEAYVALTGDEKKIATGLKKANKKAREAGNILQTSMFDGAETESEKRFYPDLNSLPEDSPDEIARKREAWESYISGDAYQSERLAEDLFCAAFFVDKSEETLSCVPTTANLVTTRRKEPLSGSMRQTVEGLAKVHRFFHWPLEFPEVFAHGGFDVVLGNPPWERIKIQEQEFFASRSREITEAPNAAARARRIQALNDPDASAAERSLFREFRNARRSAEAGSQFVRRSGSFPLTGIGDVNLYALFAELVTRVMSENGRAGVIVPSGIATDDNTKYFFEHVATQGMLASLIDFENREKIFKAVDSRQKFCLLTLGSKIHYTDFIFFLTQAHHTSDHERHFTLTAEDVNLLNPNTRTCPTFRSRRDAELTKKIYRAAPVLMRDEDEVDGNPWGIKFSRLFDMSNDSGLFRTHSQLLEQGAAQNGPNWRRDDSIYVPLYEAKMIHQFDHRWATYETNGKDSRDVTLEEKQKPDFSVRPRYWVDEWEVTKRITEMPSPVFSAMEARRNKAPDAEQKLVEVLAQWVWGYLDAAKETARRIDFADGHLENSLAGLSPADKKRGVRFQADTPLTEHELAEVRESADLWDLVYEWMNRRRRRWLMGWRDICRATDERTVIASVLPPVAVGNKIPLIQRSVFSDVSLTACLHACLCSLCLDYAARQKIGGITLNFFIAKQLPVLHPDQFSADAKAFIAPRVVELVFTDHRLHDFCSAISGSTVPYSWNPDRRALLRAELDAYYARLYGLNREELKYILDPAAIAGEDYPSETFRVLKNKETREFGEYRTQRLVLEAWDRLSEYGRDAVPVDSPKPEHRRPPAVDAQTILFTRGEPGRGDRYKTFIPELDLRAAAGPIDETQSPEPVGWIRPGGGIAITNKMFAGRVVGDSMEPIIPKGSLCLFERKFLASWHNKIVCLQLRDAMDPDTGGKMAVKWCRVRTDRDDFGESIVKVTLESENPKYDPIELAGDEELSGIAAFVGLLKEQDQS